MKALLDTHVLLWLVDAPERLPSRVSAICEDENNKLYVSVASFWELAIKMSLGKIELADNGLLAIKSWCDENAVVMIPISLSHCQVIRQLPFHHRDLFDRLIVAQGMSDGLSILSRDAQLERYELDVIWD